MNSRTPEPQQPNSPARPPGVACSDLLAELRSVLNKLDDLLEAARGPGKHSVYMSLKDAKYHCGHAFYAEECRIARESANTELSDGR